MYLAEQKTGKQTHYFIRESVKDGCFFRSRDLFCLGTNPAGYIIYPGGNAFYIDDVVEDRLSDLGVRANQDDLEDIFWPFLNPRIRRLVDAFKQKARARRKKVREKPKQDDVIRAQVSDFDKRRVHYLRFGGVEHNSIYRMPVALYRWAFEKSRDEIEQRFLNMERCLNPSEPKNYTFAIFDLERFFTESWARQVPQGLDRDKMEKHFLEEICRLNEDASFCSRNEKRACLHEHLIRYVIMFFDHDYAPDSFLGDYIRNFMDARRAWRAPPNKRSVSLEEASNIFGVKKDALKTMTKRGLVRLYRRVAKTMHPDTGGTNEAFVQLTQAYHELLRIKEGRPKWTRKQ